MDGRNLEWRGTQNCVVCPYLLEVGMGLDCRPCYYLKFANIIHPTGRETSLEMIQTLRWGPSGDVNRGIPGFQVLVDIAPTNHDYKQRWVRGSHFPLMREAQRLLQAIIESLSRNSYISQSLLVAYSSLRSARQVPNMMQKWHHSFGDGVPSIRLEHCRRPLDHFLFSLD